MKKANQMNLAERLVAPKPRFFRIMRNVGLVLAAASGAILAAPVALPATLVAVAGYVAVAGSVATAISQAAVDDEAVAGR